MTKRILITGAGGPAAANFIDSLRKSGEKLYLIGSDANRYHLELTSQVDRKYILPPAEDPSYVDRLNKLIGAEMIDFVHPQPDIEVLVIGKHREMIRARTFLPALHTIELCQNKMDLNHHLRDHGVPVPLAFHLTSKADLRAALKEIKRRCPKAWLRPVTGAGSKATLPITEVDHGDQWIRYWVSSGTYRYEDFMLCEFLPGKEYAFQSLWKDGAIVTSQARERIEYVFGYLTPSGQSSSPAVARTVHNSKVNEIASMAIRTADEKASGVFCVDIKENVDSLPCITEINCGRFFTTSNFFAAAGSNMPYYYVKLAFGESIPEIPRYNAVPEGWYWIRNLDMGYRLVKGENWTSIEI